MTGTLATPASDIWHPLEDTDQSVAVSVVLKLRGETCDIDCSYCFEKRKLAPGGAHITPEQIGHLPTIFGDRPLAIELHGGEPLTVGKPAMAAILDSLAAQPTVHRVHLQTNGVRLDHEWLDLFDSHYPALNLGISMDGDEHGNSWRIGYDGTPIYERIVHALNLLAERRRTCGIVTVVTPQLLGRAAAVIDHLAGFPAVRAIHLLPAFDTTVTRPLPSNGRRSSPSRQQQADAIGADGPRWAITPAQYATFVIDAAARWIHRGHFRHIKLDPVVAAIRRIKGLDTAHCHFAARKCSHVFTAYPDGRLGSCDELPWPQARLLPLVDAGTEARVTAAQHANTLLRAGRNLMVKCLTCAYRTTCGGGCTATRYRMVTATGNDDAYCEHRAQLIDGIAHLLAAPQQPSGAHCRRAHWQPADRTGRISHPQSHDTVDTGLRRLADTLTTSWRADLYQPLSGQTAAARPHPAGSRIGLLPRSPEDYAALTARLCRTIATTDGYLPAAVTARLARTEIDAGGRRRPALELSLEPSPAASPAEYDTRLDQAARAVNHAARHATTTGECACTRRPPREPK
jgi:uncharacterized protein